MVYKQLADKKGNNIAYCNIHVSDESLTFEFGFGLFDNLTCHFENQSKCERYVSGQNNFIRKNLNLDTLEI